MDYNKVKYGVMIESIPADFLIHNGISKFKNGERPNLTGMIELIAAARELDTLIKVEMSKYPIEVREELGISIIDDEETTIDEAAAAMTI